MGGGTINGNNMLQGGYPACVQGHPLHWYNGSGSKATYNCEYCKKDVMGDEKFVCIYCSSKVCPSCGAECGYAKNPVPSSWHPSFKQEKAPEKPISNKERILAKAKEKAAKVYTSQDYGKALANFDMNFSDPAKLKKAYNTVNAGAKEDRDDTTVDLNEFVQYAVNYVRSLSGLLHEDIDEFTLVVQQVAAEYDNNKNGILDEKEFANVYNRVLGAILDRLADIYTSYVAAQFRAAGLYQDKRNNELAVKLKGQFEDRQSFCNKMKEIVRSSIIDEAVSVNDIIDAYREFSTSNGIPMLVANHPAGIIGEISTKSAGFTEDEAVSILRILIFSSIKTCLE